MKKTLLLIILLLSLLPLSQAQAMDTLNYSDKEWKIHPRGNQFFPVSIHIDALDSMNFAIARTVSLELPPVCYVEVTHDYGNTWDTIYFKDKIISKHEQIRDIAYLDKNTILFLKNDQNNTPMLHKTTDMGLTWHDIEFNKNVDNMYASSLHNIGDTVFISKSMKTFAYSFDGGDSWTIDSIPYPEGYLDSLYFPRVETKYLGNGRIICIQSFEHIESPYVNVSPTYSKFFYSNDWGKTWNLLAEYNPGYPSSFFESEGILYFSMNKFVFDKFIYKSNHEGGIDTLIAAKFAFTTNTIDIETKKQDSIQFPYIFTQCELVNDYMIAINGEQFYFSSDMGKTWNLFDSPLNKDLAYNLFNFSMPDKEHGIVNIIKGFMRLEGPTSISEQTNYISNLDVFPNPINSESILTVELLSDKNDIYDIYLIDILGNRIELSTHKYMSVGKNIVEIPLSQNLSTGSYFLALERNGLLLGIKNIIIQ